MLRVLDGAIIAKNIRLIPVSEVTRTVCMRLEIHGCSYRETLASYSIPQGSHVDGLELRDVAYDGDERDDGRLVNGIGKLFDGVLGSDNFEREPGPWIGWHKNDASNGRMISLEFNFGERRNFTAISLHTSNSRKLGAELFSGAVVLFSTSDDDLFSSRIVRFEQQPDVAFESARWVRIPINSRLAKKIRIDLTFGDSADYLLLSEVKFESNNVAFRLPDTLEDDDTTPDNNLLSIHSPNSIEIISTTTLTKHTSFGTLVYILLPFSLAVMVLIGLACYLLLPRNEGTPLKLHSKPLIGEYYDHQCCGTSSRSNASTKRYAPTPEKLSYDDSEYADPDIETGEGGMASKHYAATDLLQSQYSFAPTFW